MAETKSYTFTVVIEKEPEDPGYFAHVVELPGCVTDGATADEARARIADAIELYVATLIEDGLPIPQPESDLQVERLTLAISA